MCILIRMTSSILWSSNFPSDLKLIYHEFAATRLCRQTLRALRSAVRINDARTIRKAAGRAEVKSSRTGRRSWKASRPRPPSCATLCCGSAAPFKSSRRNCGKRLPTPRRMSRRKARAGPRVNRSPRRLNAASDRAREELALRRRLGGFVDGDQSPWMFAVKSEWRSFRTQGRGRERHPPYARTDRDRLRLRKPSILPPRRARLSLP